MTRADGVVVRKAGVKTKLFGVVLIFVGTMDAMLSWRGGLALDGFYVFLIAAGLALTVVGSIRQAHAN